MPGLVPGILLGNKIVASIKAYALRMRRVIRYVPIDPKVGRARAQRLVPVDGSEAGRVLAAVVVDAPRICPVV